MALRIPNGAGNIGTVKNRRLMASVVRWTLAFLLFAQGALVANACLRVDAGPQAAFSTAQMEGCDMGVANPNACLFAYLDQSDHGAAQPTIPPATGYLPAPAVAAAPRLARDSRTALPAPGCAPPIPIRYCTLLI